MKEFHLKISTPSGIGFDGNAARLSVRGACGELAVMAGHIPFVTFVKPGELRIYDIEGNIRTAESAGGLLTVSNELVSYMTSSFSCEE